MSNITTLNDLYRHDEVFGIGVFLSLYQEDYLQVEEKKFFFFGEKKTTSMDDKEFFTHEVTDTTISMDDLVDVIMQGDYNDFDRELILTAYAVCESEFMNMEKDRLSDIGTLEWQAAVLREIGEDIRWINEEHDVYVIGLMSNYDCDFACIKEIDVADIDKVFSQEVTVIKNDL